METLSYSEGLVSVLSSISKNKGKVKVKFTQEEATKAQRGSKVIALLFL